MVFAGAPKVGKSDFLLSMFAHMAAGVNFLSFTTTQPLRIFYLQAEVQYDYLRERLKKLELSEDIIECASDNLYATPQLRLVLNDQGLESIISHLKEKFGNKPPDIIAIDPLRNVFDGGKDGNENDNNAMLFFLTQRIEKLRAACNPNCGIILVHHTRKTTKEQLEADPFQALSGAGSLRSFYSSGMLLFRPDETRSERHLYFELRNGAALERKLVDKPENRWVEIKPMSERLVNQSYGLKLDAERIRKGEKIVKIIYEQAKSGKVYNINQFTESFESKCGLGSKDTINERIKVYATKGYIKFFKNYEKYNLPSPGATKFGYMCVEGMYLGDGDNAQSVHPTHFKHPQTGMPVEIDNPNIWIYNEEEKL
ncbi:putative Bacteriophage-related DNA primase [endosymbiont of Acanthamoeba sp. UWC8]|uniref:AAA family ATPase n=1 Tax=endosymbiont of Acanthamoeba sp. UWC8 TaxID=86106 RepID=UPI0004D11A79|nr:AAA family ATPase [endosymbiont of Acanthamoeba sp. UWC8]AIF82036.1 putative Bacteriophage-related DNA primase [endosymbiont of Acanthamoeba sp. UWC8]